MRWEDRRRSENVEDRRGMSPGGMVVGGGAGLLIIFLIATLFGADPGQILDQMQRTQVETEQGGGTPQPIDPGQGVRTEEPGSR